MRHVHELRHVLRDLPLTEPERYRQGIQVDGTYALESSVQQEIDALALGGPRALAEAKRLLRRIPRLSVDDGFRYAEEEIAELFASEEAAEGMAAFAGRRPPSWAG